MKVSDKTDSYLMKLVRFDEEEFTEINKNSMLETGIVFMVTLKWIRILNR